jgi:hypothetical protein
MPKASRGDPFLAETNVGQEGDAVFQSHADGKGGEHLPEGLETLRSAYQEFWAETHHPTPPPEILNPRTTTKAKVRSFNRQTRPTAVLRAERRAGPNGFQNSRRAKQRFGLPEGFMPRMQRFGRGILLELNIYSLPNGQEFIPCLPTGPLGSRHLYALLTSEQHSRGSRGSIYVRGDGKIFDYSVVSANPAGDMFDTGYTIHDLERTGRYAPDAAGTRQKPRAASTSKRPVKQKVQHKKSRRAATES